MMIKFLLLLKAIASASGGHWEEWVVYRKDCGILEKRCVADSPSEINPNCERNEQLCDGQKEDVSSESSFYSSWEEALTKIYGTINLKIGDETKKVPIMISTDGTKYLIFQRRLNGVVNFYRKWNDYVEGFGNAEGEYWIGLRALNILTSTGKFNMTVFLESFNHTQVFARYGLFKIDGPVSNYKLTIGDYSGTAGNAMASINNMMFTTQDKDHDTWYDNCAVKFRGAWWYADCHSSNLNGNYYPAPGNHSNYADGVNWYQFLGFHVSMKKSVMALSLK